MQVPDPVKDSFLKLELIGFSNSGKLIVFFMIDKI